MLTAPGRFHQLLNGRRNGDAELQPNLTGLLQKRSLLADPFLRRMPAAADIVQSFQTDCGQPAQVFGHWGSSSSRNDFSSSGSSFASLSRHSVSQARILRDPFAPPARRNRGRFCFPARAASTRRLSGVWLRVFVGFVARVQIAPAAPRRPALSAHQSTGRPPCGAASAGSWNDASGRASPARGSRHPARRYMDATSLISCGDQNRSAMAAVRGQMRESTFSGLTNSVHMQTSPPRMRDFSAGVRLPLRSPAGPPRRASRPAPCDRDSSRRRGCPSSLAARLRPATSVRARIESRYLSADPRPEFRPSPPFACRASRRWPGRAW